jgi:hypothetical protein
MLYPENCYLTLTYDEKTIPNGGSLHYQDFVLFLKRLRKKYGPKIRFYMCGEYGELLGRPHFHAIIFNFDFPDKLPFQKNPNGDLLYVSESLQKLWPYGHSTIGDVNFQSAAYVARYCLKKVTGDKAAEHYGEVITPDGEIIPRSPEFTQMSRMPGIGRGWYEKFKNDVFPHDHVILNNKQFSAPKYYGNLYQLENLPAYNKIKNKRIRKSRKHAKNNTPERLSIRAELQALKAARLKRTLI